MKLLIAGSSGMIGQTLVPLLNSQGHEVWSLVRRDPKDQEIRWYPSQNILPRELLEGFDGLVHLGGESIAEGRWTARRKERIRDSRVQSTQLLANTLRQLQTPPRVFVCASAVGYYGDRGEEPLEESSPAGQGFLADVCQAWEAATQPAAEAGIRVVNARLGMVLSARGGALAKMLLPFRMGAGGIVGSGRQYWSWISLDDAAAAFANCLQQESLSGPVNLVAPQQVTNRTFTKTLGSVLGRPTIFPLPAVLAQLMLGEMAKELLLSSTRVVPRCLIDAGFPFRHGELEPALRFCLQSS